MKKMFNRYVVVLIVGCVVTLLAPGCSKKLDGPEHSSSEKVQHVLATTTLLTTIAADDQPQASDSNVQHSENPAAATTTPVFFVELDSASRGVTFVAKQGELVRAVHNGKSGKLYKDIDTTSLKMSPDGQRLAYAAKTGDKWFMVHDGKEEGPFDSLGPPVFSSDNRHLAFECKKGDKWHLNVDGKLSAGVFSFIDKPAFSGNSQLLLFGETGVPEHPQRIVVCDLTFKETQVIKGSGGPVAFSADGNRAAVIEEMGAKKRVVTVKYADPAAVTSGSLYDEVRSLVFSNDGSSLAYLAKKGTVSYLVLNGREERLPEGEYPWPPVIRPDNKGVGIAVVGKGGAYLHEAFSATVSSQNRYKELADLVYSSDNSRHAYVAIKDERFLIVATGKEGRRFDRVITPQFSPDGKHLVYRARQEGKRFVVVADPDGTIRRKHPPYDRVFDPVFTADGKSVAYGVMDGRKVIWKVEGLHQ